LHIVQIAPEIGPGSGVGMVAYALEKEFQAAGAHVERFTLTDARGKPTPASRSRLKLAWDVVWFSTTGTRRAKTFLAARPDAVSICHNDALAGDVYVNHGILPAAMRARGHYRLRMLRNPLHLFTLLRDRVRYRGDTHEAIVALSSSEARLLGEEYGRVRAPITVIGNGVDLERFHPATAEERAAARSALNIAQDAFTVIFIGHEFDRKGLPILIEALGHTRDDIVLLVVGGTEDMIAHARSHAARSGVADRVIFAGEQRDVRASLHAADALALLSAYEASALVLLEALASGVPVIATDVGIASDAIEDGVNGYLTPGDPIAVAHRLESLASGGLARLRDNALERARAYAWQNIARRYLELLDSVRSSRGSNTSVK
jgi:UDP-glucose:(heptosyl)LPS alpha-1,3-glucosyltransferase